MKFFQKTRGSVSIFLVLILVPVLVVTSLFVDVSRIELVKALAASSGDLTLNTMLTQYDTALNEHYGLLASSQNIDEFLDNAEDYFVACMVSQGVSTTEAKKYAGEISKLMDGEGEIADFLNVDLTETNAKVSKMEDADLANATLVKNEVVEFMKYRAPMNTLTDFIDKMASVEEDIKDKPMEAELTNQKNQFYEAENEMLQKALEVFLLCREYNDYKITAEYIKEIEDYLNGLEGNYKELHKRYIKDWNNTGGELGQKVFKSVSTDVDMDPGGNYFYGPENSVDESSLMNAINACAELRMDYEGAKRKLEEQINNAGINVVYSNNNYDIQYWIQTAEAISKGSVYQEFIKAANTMYRAYANMCDGYDKRITYIETRQTVSKEIKKEVNGKVVVEIVDEVIVTRQDVPLSEGTKNAYNAEMSAISSIKSGFSSMQIQTISKKLEEISTYAINNEVTSRKKASNDIGAVATKLQEYYDKLKQASDKMKQIMNELLELKRLAKIYGEKFENWNTYANSFHGQRPENEMAEDDLEEIKDLQDTAGKNGTDTTKLDKMDSYINEISVMEMHQRCNNINSLLGSFIVGMDRYQYYNRPIRTITNYPIFDQVAAIDQTQITIINQQLEDYVNSTWAIPVFTKPAEGDIHKVSENNHPEFKVKPPKLYNWMFEDKFKGYKEAKGKEGKEKFDTIKKQMENQETTQKEQQEKNKAQTSTNEILNKDKTKLPSEGKKGGGPKGSGDNAKKSGERLNNASKDTQEIVGNTEFDMIKGFKSLRDNLYFTDYIMSMFSYDTYELENKFNLLRKGYEKDDVYKTKKGIINSSNAKFFYDSTEVEDDWKNPSTLYTQNKTLTNKMIDSKNNYSYGNEAEYILYGGKNKDNKLDSYATIYGMRYAINIAPVFKRYWNDQIIVIPSSNLIAGLTYGVVPASLVQLVICLGVTAAETAVDISYLKVGLPVLFIKKDRHLFLRLDKVITENVKGNSGFTENTEKEKIKSEACFSYSDYLFLFFMIGTIDSGDKIYLRTADVVQCNMQQKEESKEFLMKDATVYFDIEANVKVKPLMLGVPFIREEGASALDSSSWNSFTYTGTRGY